MKVAELIFYLKHTENWCNTDIKFLLRFSTVIGANILTAMFYFLYKYKKPTDTKNPAIEKVQS